MAATVSLPDSADAIVLLDPDQRPEGILPWHPFHNVLRVAPQGEVRWRAELHPANTWKCWVSIAYDDDVLRAWDGAYVCELDVETGGVIRATFTK